MRARDVGVGQTRQEPRSRHRPFIGHLPDTGRDHRAQCGHQRRQRQDTVDAGIEWQFLGRRGVGVGVLGGTGQRVGDLADEPGG